MRGHAAVASALLVVASAGTATASGAAAHHALRLIALPPSATAPAPDDMRIDAAGKYVIVGEDGPHVWRWRNGAGAPAPHAEDIDPLGCGDLEGGIDDVAVTTDGHFYAVNDCVPAAAGEFEWSSTGTKWNPGQNGVGHVIDVDNDGGFISTDTHRPGHVYFVSHTVAGPGGVAGAVIFRQSSDGGSTWAAPVYVNAPTNYAPDQRLSAVELDGPDLYTPAVADPGNPKHLTIAWTAESEVDFAQDHADDSLDRYEWDTSAHIANSYDGGRTWSAQTILNTGQHPPGTQHSAYNDIAGWQPSLAAGPHGVFYLGFTEMFAGTKVWQPRVMRSVDDGRTWSRPASLPHPGSAFATSLAVWHHELIAGWYSSRTTNALNPRSTWDLLLSRYAWKPSGSPRLIGSVHTGVVHVGVEQPINTSTGQDPLHDSVDLAVDGKDVLAPAVVGDGAKARPYLVVWRL